MRTTLTLDDDIVRAAKAIAEAQDVSIGRAVSDLARKGLAARRPVTMRNGFAVISVPEGSPPLTLEDGYRLEDG